MKPCKIILSVFLAVIITGTGAPAEIHTAPPVEPAFADGLIARACAEEGSGGSMVYTDEADYFILNDALVEDGWRIREFQIDHTDAYPNDEVRSYLGKTPGGHLFWYDIVSLKAADMPHVVTYDDLWNTVLGLRVQIWPGYSPDRERCFYLNYVIIENIDHGMQVVFGDLPPPDPDPDEDEEPVDPDPDPEEQPVIIETELVSGQSVLNFERAGILMNVETDRDGEITVKSYKEDKNRNRPSGTISLNRYYEISASGLNDAVIDITVKFDPLKMPAGVNVNRIGLYSYDETASRWVFLPKQEINTGDNHIIFTGSPECLSALGIFKPVIYGDVTGTGSVSIQDAVYVLRSVAGLAELNEFQEIIADLNGDNTVNVHDAILMLRLITGLWSSDHL